MTMAPDVKITTPVTKGGGPTRGGPTQMLQHPTVSPLNIHLLSLEKQLI